MRALEPLVGERSMRVDIPGAPPGDIGARTTFEWMEGGEFLIQRWTVPVPDAPDGIAIIGLDPEGDGYLHTTSTRVESPASTGWSSLAAAGG